MLTNSSIIADDVFEISGAAKKDSFRRNFFSGKYPLQKNKHLCGGYSKKSFISMTKGNSMFGVTQRICRQMQFNPNIVMQSPDPAFIRKCVELNLGITFVPVISWKGLFSEEVIIKKLDGFYHTTYAYQKGNKYMKKSIKNFLEMFKKECAKNKFCPPNIIPLQVCIC